MKSSLVAAFPAGLVCGMVLAGGSDQVLGAAAG
jgi:hypothetical protein